MFKKPVISYDKLYDSRNYEDIVKNIIIDFPTIFDTDFGTIAYMCYHYGKSKYIKEECKDWTPYFTKCKLLTRKDINPLSILLKDEYIDNADNLYKELLDSKWDDILKLSPITDVMNLVYSLYDYIGNTVTVKCRNEEEVKYIKENVKDWESMIGDEDTDKYFCYFIYDLCERVKHLTGIRLKTIYVYYHAPNMINFKEGILKQDAVGILDNNIKLIVPYRGLVLPYDMTPDDMEVVVNGKEYSAK